MSSLSQRIGDFLGVPVTSLAEAGRQHGVQHVTGTLADGRAIFAKIAQGPAAAIATAFASEANGLRWLAETDDGPPIPQVIGVSAEFLVIELIEPQQRASPEAARRLGADLARMHATGASAFGAPWPGYIASLPLDNTPSGDTAPGRATPANTDWAAWYAERRLVPYLRRARADSLLSRAEASQVEIVVGRIGELAGPPEPPSRIHGDLWSGNILWSRNRGWVIDPAAHGGHRETDLAMLALFGAPYLGEIVRGYTETKPLAGGWRDRVPLHQLHPLLVHVCLFGRGYAPQLTAAARAALAG